MPSDWKALSDGIPPHSLVHLIAYPVPALLVEDPNPPIVTNNMVLTRDMAILDATQKNVNAIMDATRSSGMAQLRNSYFDAIRRSLWPNAPLLLAAVEAAHPLTGVYAAWHDGPAAFADIVARSAPATSLDPETDDHEDHMAALRLKLLPDGASSEGREHVVQKLGRGGAREKIDVEELDSPSRRYIERKRRNAATQRLKQGVVGVAEHSETVRADPTEAWRTKVTGHVNKNPDRARQRAAADLAAALPKNPALHGPALAAFMSHPVVCHRTLSGWCG